MGAALSGATTAEAAPPRSGAPEGPTSFFDTGTMMRPRFCGAGTEDEEEGDDDDADATIVAERCVRIMFAGIALGGRRLLRGREKAPWGSKKQSGTTTASEKKTTGNAKRAREREREREREVPFCLP